MSWYETIEEPDVIGVGPNSEPLDFLMAVYRSPSLPIHTRLRAASEAAKYRHAQLKATAIFSGQDFAQRLERAVLRSAKAGLIEEQPAAQSFKRRF